MEIAEIITTDGEIFTKEDLSNKKLQFNLLKHLDFNTIQEFYFNKTIVANVKEKEQKSGGSNGATIIDILDNFKSSKIEPYIAELIKKGYLIKRESINLDVYFTKQKTR